MNIIAEKTFGKNWMIVVETDGRQKENLIAKKIFRYLREKVPAGKWFYQVGALDPSTSMHAFESWNSDFQSQEAMDKVIAVLVKEFLS